MRRLVFRLTGARLKKLDPYLRGTKMSDEKQRAWFSDQYQHPHESKHTMGEVLRWYDRTGFDFVNGVPKFKIWDDFEYDEKLFEEADPGSAFERGLSQARMVVTGSKEGGFYIVIGRKRDAA
jgi:hypothetical protein